MSRPRLETLYFVDVETKTLQDWEICWMSKQRLIKLGKFFDVETKISQDWAKNYVSGGNEISRYKFAKLVKS